MSSFLKGLGAVLLIAIVAGLVAAVILLATDAGQDTDIGRFIGDGYEQTIDGIKSFIEQNTAGS